MVSPKRAINIALLLLIARVLSGQTAEWGELDLRGYDFVTDGPVLLEGAWEIHWLTHADEVTDDPKFQRVPGDWTDAQVLSAVEPLDPEGFATYRLRLTLPANVEELSLLLREIAFSYEVYWNGKLLHQQGVLGADAATNRPSLQQVIVPVPDQQSSVDLRIEVANYRFDTGWIRPPVLGTTQILSRRWARWAAANGLLVGMLFYMVVHRFLIALLSPDRRQASLALAAMALVAALRLALEDGRLVELFFPSLPWAFAIRTIYSLVPLGAMTMAIWLGRLYPEESVVTVKQSIVALGGVILVFLWVVPVALAARSLILYEFFFLVSAFYVVAVLWSALRRRPGEATLFGIGFVALVASTVAELSLVRSSMVNMNLSYLGFVAFLATQNLILSRRFSDRIKVAASSGSLRIPEVDPLTGIADCERMERFLGYCQRLAARYGTPYTIVVFDVDHFRDLERAHGAPIAREVLKKIAKALEQSLRNTDLACRRDNDTFMAALPLTPFPASRDYAERVRSALSSLDHAGVGFVTVSYGLSAWLNDERVEDVTDRAERALRLAKASGRNRGCTHLDVRVPN